MLQRKHIYHSFFLAVIYLSSCAVGDYVVSGDQADVQQPPSSMNGGNIGLSGLPSMWIGKSVSELVDGLGKPDMMIDTLPRGAGFSDGVCKYAYVYLPKPEAADQCIRAYVIDDLSGEVIKFYCR